MALLDALDKVYPRAMWPSPRQLVGFGAWGGVLVAGVLFAVQPIDFVKETLGLNKAKPAEH